VEKKNNAMNKVRHFAGIARCLLAACTLHAQRSPATPPHRLQTMPRALQKRGLRAAAQRAHAFWTSRSATKLVAASSFAITSVIKNQWFRLVYYGCPMLCDQVEQGVVGALRMLSFNPGRDYEVVFRQLRSREIPEMAAERKRRRSSIFPPPGNGFRLAFPYRFEGIH